MFAGPLLRGGPTGIGSGVGLRKEDPELKVMFDNAITDLRANGTAQGVSEKWFKLDLTPVTARAPPACSASARGAGAGRCCGRAMTLRCP